MQCAILSYLVHHCVIEKKLIMPLKLKSPKITLSDSPLLFFPAQYSQDAFRKYLQPEENGVRGLENGVKGLKMG